MSAETETKPVVAEEEKKEVEAPPAEKKDEEKGDGDAKEKTEEKEGGKGKKEAVPPPPPPPRVHKQDFEKDVVYLYQYCRTSVMPSLSPFCLKVETFLRLYGIKYENVDHKLKFKSSKGQLPFVELNGEEIADSAMIISKLSQHFGVDADANLTKEEKNVSHALISMIENHLCWVYVYWRSKNTDDFVKGTKLNIQSALNSKIPNSLLNIVFKWTYSRKGSKKVKAHGLGVHTSPEVLEFGKQDLQVLEDTLGSKDFFFGSKASNVDVVAFSHLSQIAYVDKAVKFELRDWMEENCPGLMGFLARMKEQCFPDWDDILRTLKLNPPYEEEKEPEKEATKDKEAGDKEKTEEIKVDEEKKEEVKTEEAK